ncbi:hypothetical protein [Brazilian marseillevirus]|uniref:hypothetical protein n=1 Tax=Brazilian marseillevirus TaxID=1813599 RepID=UPI0007837D2F|nr:hypothetical protein A3303_gp363 [Brazilian marseillevirus]AMQ10871.1 hypothetical protein [Brazilian marseillevirus]
MKENISLLWFKMFGNIGVKVKCDGQTFLFGAKEFPLFKEEVETVTRKDCEKFYFVDGDGDKINIKDETSFLYFVESWNMETTLNIFSEKYIQISFG